MKKLSTLGILCATAVCVLFLSACEKKKPIDRPEQKLTLSAVPTSLVQGASTTFTVKLDELDVTSSAVITEISSGTTVSGAEWSSETVGTYTFEATYEEFTSEIVTVTVTESVVTAETISFAPKFTTSSGSDAPYNEIGVFAFGTGASSWNAAYATATPVLMYDSTLTFDADEWSYNPAVEWPEGNTSFFAYAPVATDSNGVSVSEATATGAPILTFDMSEGGLHTDVLIGTSKDKTETSEAVELPLRSVMAKLGVRIKGDEGQKVSKVVITGLVEKASIALDKADDAYFTWTLERHTANRHEIELSFDEGRQYVTATETMTDITAADGYLYVFPQNYTYEARVIVTVDGKDIGFPFEGVMQTSPGEEYFFELNLSSTPMDYTDNYMPAFYLAPQDAAETQNITIAAAKAACEADGYRLPTQNESAFILIYMNGIEDNNYRFASYWTSTYYKQDQTNAMGYNIAPSYLLYMPAGTAITAARCVKDGPEGKRYPYVDTSSTDGPIIVSRDADGGAIPEAYNPLYEATLNVFHENWTTTPDHNEMTTADAIPHKLQIANADAGTDMIALTGALVCANGWRVPTHKELMLIYAMGGAGSSSYDTSVGSAFYNAPLTDTPLNGASGFTPFKGDHYWSATKTQSGRTTARCSFPFTETPIRANGKIREDFSGQDAYLRCVRDVE